MSAHAAASKESLVIMRMASLLPHDRFVLFARCCTTCALYVQGAVLTGVLNVDVYIHR